jgi:hypothetical protein
VTTAIRDIELVSLEAADYHTQAEIPTLSASGFTQFTDDESLRFGPGNPYEDRPHRLILKVQFMTNVDLPKFVGKNGYSLGARAFFCDRPGDPAFLSYISVYRRGIDVASRRIDPIVGGAPQALSTYYFFMNTVAPSTVRARVSYDLRQDPQDVCFYLSGGNPPTGFRSNVATISKDAIALALRSELATSGIPAF